MTQQNNSDPEQILKEVVEKIQQFFSHQIETNGSLSEAAKESLTVAIECIEQAYSIQRKPASRDIADIYISHKQQQTNQGSNAAGPQAADASQLINLASTLFQQAGGGILRGAAAAAMAASANGQQETATASSTTPTGAQSSAQQPSAPPKQRKKASEAEKMAAESFKTQGNDAMREDKYKEAYDYYTRAIEIDDNNAIYYSNRAAASSKLGNHQAALDDCRKAIEVDPNYSKAYGRLGLAYASLDNHLEAKKAYVKAVELDPTNESYRNNLHIAEEKLSGGGTGPSAGAAAGPASSNVMGMLSSMMSNPQVMSMAMRSLQDPRFQSMFGLGENQAAGGNQQSSAPNGQQRPPASSEPQQASATNNHSSNQQAPPTAGGQSTTPPSSGGQQSQQTPPAFNPADLLNLTSRIAGEANIDLVGAGQQLLSSIQSNNPDLVDNMRRMMSQAFMNPNQGDNQNDRNPPPGYS